ncbi:MAG: 5-oxoprolinase subunit B [Catillopecten margaritatus gill symbiont]|uniref:5-oxoprolinase subunit B n=1 Tax=Catillopecten margaritatus gill symbiont TaxID=3083288 RepID=A0AAU6PFN8_9GAMM
MHKIILASEDSILIYFGDKVNASLPIIIQNFANQIKATLSDVVIDVIPSYTSIQVRYDLNKIEYSAFVERVSMLLNQAIEMTSCNAKLVQIPVYYDTEVGLDLKRLLNEKNLDLPTFIALHSNQQYQVYAVGFSPAFAYLGEVDTRIQVPRLPTPRIKIPAGSVGIADNQTAVYPVDSSGGWNIVGRTPLDLSLKNPDNIRKFGVGDTVTFHSITRDEFLSSGGVL